MGVTTNWGREYRKPVKPLFIYPASFLSLGNKTLWLSGLFVWGFYRWWCVCVGCCFPPVQPSSSSGGSDHPTPSPSPQLTWLVDMWACGLDQNNQNPSLPFFFYNLNGGKYCGTFVALLGDVWPGTTVDPFTATEKKLVWEIVVSMQNEQESPIGIQVSGVTCT